MPDTLHNKCLSFTKFQRDDKDFSYVVENLVIIHECLPGHKFVNNNHSSPTDVHVHKLKDIVFM